MRRKNPLQRLTETTTAGLTGLVCLPKIARFDVQACQPSAFAGAGINAEGEAEIFDGAGLLATVTAHDLFAGAMGLDGVEEFPKEQKIRLLVQVEIGIDASVNEDVIFCFVESTGGFEEAPMGRRHA